MTWAANTQATIFFCDTGIGGKKERTFANNEELQWAGARGGVSRAHSVVQGDSGAESVIWPLLVHSSAMPHKLSDWFSGFFCDFWAAVVLEWQYMWPYLLPFGSIPFSFRWQNNTILFNFTFCLALVIQRKTFYCIIFISLLLFFNFYCR